MPEFGGIIADDDRGEVRFRGMAAYGLTRAEFSVFRFLLDKRGRVATKEAILDNLYQLAADEPEIKIIDVFVCKLRKKVSPLGLRIETAWARGYYLAPPAPEAASTTVINGSGDGTEINIINDITSAARLIDDESMAEKGA